jgi:hypothetical protein
MSVPLSQKLTTVNREENIFGNNDLFIAAVGHSGGHRRIDAGQLVRRGESYGATGYRSLRNSPLATFCLLRDMPFAHCFGVPCIQTVP